MKQKLTFNLLKTTSGALRYQEVDENSLEPKMIGEGAAVGTLYVRKSTFDSQGMGYPSKITVTIEAEED